MNKRERLAYIKHRIFARAIELFGDDMTFVEARREAAIQVASEERAKGAPPTGGRHRSDVLAGGSRASSRG